MKALLIAKIAEKKNMKAKYSLFSELKERVQAHNFERRLELEMVQSCQ